MAEEIDGIKFTVEAEEKGIDKATASMDRMGKQADKTDKTIGKFNLGIDKYGNTLTQADKKAGRFIDSTGRMREKSGQFVKGLNEANGSLSKFNRLVNASVSDLKSLAVSAGVATAAIGAISAANSQANRELEAQARQAGVSVSEYQKLAFAASQAGIEQEKFGDITKDVQDKVGDFLATGGGELADFFENVAPKVGVTADQFRGLSGPEALGLFINTLERANVSQEEAIFYTESLADEASRLRGVFGGGGEAIAEAGRRMDELGTSIDNIDVRRSAELSSSFGLLATTISNSTTKAVSAFSDEIESAVNLTIRGINTMSEGFVALFDQLRNTDARRSIKGLQQEIGELVTERERLRSGEGVSFIDGLLGKDSEAKIAELNEEIFALQDRVVQLIKESSSGEKALNIPGLVIGKGSGSGTGDIDNLNDKLSELESQLERNVALYGKDARAVAKSDAILKASIAAREQGVKLTAEQQYKIETLVDEYYDLIEAEERAAKADTIKDRVDSLRQYERAWKRALELHKDGLLTDQELAKYKAHLDKMASTAGEAGKDAGDEFGNSFIDAADLGGALAESIMTGDFSGVGKVLGSSVSKSLSDSISSSIGGSAGGLIGGFAGAIGGSVIGGLLAGSTKKQTGAGYEIDIDLGEVVGAQLTESFKKSSFFGSSSWTEFRSLTRAEFDELANSIAESGRDIGRYAESLGVSIDEYSGTIKDKNGTLSDGVNRSSEVIANSVLAAAEKYKEVGETYLSVIQSLADQSDAVRAGLESAGADYDRLKNEFAQQQSQVLTELYQSELDALTAARDDAVQQAINSVSRFRETGDGSFAVRSIGEINREQARKAKKAAEEYAADIEEITSRLNDTFAEAGVQFDQSVLKTLQNVAGVSESGAINLFTEISGSFAENYRTAEEQLQMAIDSARDAFGDVAFGGLTLESTKDDVAAIFDQLTDPEDKAKLLLAADALADYNKAIAESAEASKKIYKDLLSDLSSAISAESAKIKDAYSDQIEAVSEAADAERELLRSRKDSASETISSLKAVQSAARSGLNALSAGATAESVKATLSGVISSLSSGGNVSADVINQAVSGFQSIDSSSFGSAAEAEFQQAVVANQLKSIDDLTSSQISIEEKTLYAIESQIEQSEINEQRRIDALEQTRDSQIDALDRQYSELQSQTNALLGIDDSVKSVSEAIEALIIQTQKSENYAKEPVLSVDSDGSVLPMLSSGGSGASSSDASNESIVRDAYSSVLGLTGSFENAEKRVDYWVNQLDSGKVSHSDFRNVFTVSAFTSQGDLVSDAEFAARTRGFATGGFTGMIGRDKIAGVVHGQEGVLNAGAMQNIGIPTLNALNSGASPSDLFRSSVTMDVSGIVSVLSGISSTMTAGFNEMINNQREIEEAVTSAFNGAGFNVRLQS